MEPYQANHLAKIRLFAFDLFGHLSMDRNIVADGASVRTLPCQFIRLLWVVLGGWRLLSDPL